MRKEHTEQYRVITADAVEIFNERLNEALDDLSQYTPSVTFHQANPMFAYIKYTVTREVPETLADEYRAKGIQFQCGDCPLIRGTDDGRRRYCWCDYRSGFMRSSPACDEFYKMLARGEIFKEGGSE